MKRGQAIVEMALMLPVFLFAALAFCESGILIATWSEQQRQTGVLADWVVEHPNQDWSGVQNKLGLQNCTITVDAKNPLDIVHAGVSCHYTPRITSNIWNGLAISTEADAAEIIDLHGKDLKSLVPSSAPSPEGSAQ